LLKRAIAKEFVRLSVNVSLHKPAAQRFGNQDCSGQSPQNFKMESAEFADARFSNIVMRPAGAQAG
jgi:hypothetical protein